MLLQNGDTVEGSLNALEPASIEVEVNRKPVRIEMSRIGAVCLNSDLADRTRPRGVFARGAKVVNVRVYKWDLPEDTAPLAENIKAIIAGDRDVLIVTSAHQVANLLRMAQQLGVEQPLREALSRLAVASVGPTTSEMLREHELPVDIEPEHPKMGPLVAAAAEQAGQILERKRRVGSAHNRAGSVRQADANAVSGVQLVRGHRAGR